MNYFQQFYNFRFNSIAQLRTVNREVGNDSCSDVQFGFGESEMNKKNTRHNLSNACARYELLEVKNRRRVINHLEAPKNRSRVTQQREKSNRKLPIIRKKLPER